MENSPLHILLVEDNPMDQFLVEEMLRSSGLNIQSIQKVEEARDAADLLHHQVNIDLVLLDLTLPGSIGIDTFNTVHNADPSKPVIILTGTLDSSIALEALKAGAQDFLVKNELNRQVLSRSITYSLERKKFEEKLKESEARFALQVAELERKKRIEVIRSTIAAQESERKVLGEDLHDNINQILSSVKIYLEIAMADPKSSHHLIQKSHDQICQSIQEIRYLSTKLIAPEEHLLELADMVSQVANDISLSKGIQFDLDMDAYNSHLVVPEQRLDIYRIIQEQFNNIVRHSKASKVWLKLEQAENSILLFIEDNGKGVDLSVDHQGLGLKNMHGRIELYNGQLLIKSMPDQGFSLMVKMDLIN